MVPCCMQALNHDTYYAAKLNNHLLLYSLQFFLFFLQQRFSQTDQGMRQLVLILHSAVVSVYILIMNCRVQKLRAYSILIH